MKTNIDDINEIPIKTHHHDATCQLCGSKLKWKLSGTGKHFGGYGVASNEL